MCHGDNMTASRPAFPGGRSLVRLAADGTSRTFRVEPRDNWLEVLAVWPSTVSAGDIQLWRIEADPDTQEPIAALMQTIGYAANGARALVHLPPGARISARVSGYAGSGDVRALATSWPEA